MNKYEKALDWLTWRCMEPNEDYDGLVYDQMYKGMKVNKKYSLEELGL